MYSQTNVTNGSLIEYKQEVMANNNNGCHVDVDNKKFGRNCRHGPSVPFPNEVSVIKFILGKGLSYLFLFSVELR